MLTAKPSLELKELNNVFEENLKKVEEIGFDEFLRSVDFSNNDLEKLYFYEKNIDNPDVYNLLERNFSYDSNEDKKKIFELIEITNIIQDYYLKEHGNKIGWRCAAAIGGTIIATASLAFAPGPGWALVWALASKAVATGAVIDSCIPDEEKVAEKKPKIEELEKIAEPNIGRYMEYYNQKHY